MVGIFIESCLFKATGDCQGIVIPRVNLIYLKLRNNGKIPAALQLTRSPRGSYLNWNISKSPTPP